MGDAYFDLLRQWQREYGLPAVYNSLDTLLPEYGFKRKGAGGPRDHWESPLKLDLSQPKVRNAQKTVIYRSELKFREQGEWGTPIGMIDHLMAFLRFSTPLECWSYLNDRLSLTMPQRESSDVQKLIRAQERRKAMLSFLQDMFVETLWNTKDRKAGECRTYLRNRGLDKEKAQKAGLGFAPKWSVIARKAGYMGFQIDEIMETCGVVDASKNPSVGREHVLTIPYVCGEELSGFLFRRIDGNDFPKYIASKSLDRASVFFGIEKCPPQRIIVVEGEMDAITLKSAGIPGVVSIGGSSLSGSRRKQVEDALNRGVKEMVLFPDLDLNEETGELMVSKRHAAIMQSIHTIKDVNLFFEGIRVVEVGESGDPDSFVRDRGVDAVKKMIDEAVPYWDYLKEYNQEQS